MGELIRLFPSPARGDSVGDAGNEPTGPSTVSLGGDSVPVRAGQASDRSNHPIGPTADKWIRGRRARGSINEKTEYGQRLLLEEFAEFVGPDTPLAAVTTSHFEAWLAQPRRNGREYAKQSINSRSNPVRAFLRWAKDSGLIDVDPAASVDRAKAPKRFPKGLGPDEVTRLLWASGMMDRTMILVGVQLGLRRGEIADMNVEHWDRRDDVLYVIGKGDKERTLPVAGEIAQALDAWISMALGGRRSGPVWPSTYAGHDRLSGEQVGRRVKTVAELAGVNATTHSLRHTCGTDLVRAGAPMPIVQWWLGHESIATTGLYVVPGAAELRTFATARTYLPAGLTVPTVA